MKGSEVTDIGIPELISTLGFFFYLVGLLYPLPYGFQYSKKQKTPMETKLSITLYTLDIRNKLF